MLHKSINSYSYVSKKELENWLVLFYKVLNSFVEIPKTDLEESFKRLKHLYIKKNNYFVRTDDFPDKMAFIARGVFRVFYNTEKGDEKILVFREEGCMLSAFSAYLKNEKSWYNIQALEDSDLLYVSFSDYKKFINKSLCWQIVNSKYIEMLFIEKEERESEFLSDNAEIRYKKFIKRYPNIENRINQYHVAAYLGITPVALSRIKNKL